MYFQLSTHWYSDEANMYKQFATLSMGPSRSWLKKKYTLKFAEKLGGESPTGSSVKVLATS